MGFNDRLSRKLKPDVLAELESGSRTARGIYEAIKDGNKNAIATDKRVVMALVELQIEGKVISVGTRGKAKTWILQEIFL